MLGEPVYIVVDDTLPIMDAGAGYTYTSTGSRYATFMSGKSENGAWWLPILEKAYAKFTKTYADLNGGNEWEALRAMTGMPAKNYRTDQFSETELYSFIRSNDRNHYVMTCGCHRTHNGLVAGHAYSLLGVNESTGRIIVRNPWASERYYGEGSD